MSAPKATFNFQDYRGILPYASELFGVYQPLLGWRSKRHERRFKRGYAADQLGLLEQLSEGVAPTLTVDAQHNAVHVTGFDPGRPLPEVKASRSLLVTALRQTLFERHGAGASAISDAELGAVVAQATMTSLLSQKVASAVNARLHAATAHPRASVVRGAAAISPISHAKQTMQHEARLAAMMLRWKDNGELPALRKLLFAPDWIQRHAGLERAANSRGPLEHFLPATPTHLPFDLEHLALSPIGVVHLFRQYFFELDTFLGTPVGHVWVSPGTTLELYEVSTRKVMTERTWQQTLDVAKKGESLSSTKDELADAVKQDNSQDIKFGASVQVSYSGVTASSNFDLANTQKEARESTHKHMREQSTKLTMDIKTSFKTSFKVVTESTDVSSRRYVIQNPSPTLQNYELRRKMRQVAVQVQDVGSYLCWQTYVDNPGESLDIATLVHVAEPADLESIPHPDAPALLETQSKDYPIAFQYENTSGGDDNEVIFYQGNDQESWPDHNDTIVWERDFKLDAPALGYTIDKESLKVVSLHSDVCAPRVTALDDTGKVRVSLDQVNFAKMPAVNLQVTATWVPPSQSQALTDYANKMIEYNNAKARLQKEAYNKAVRERIKLASKVTTRPVDDLREEERITIYRHLIQEMLLPKGYGPDDAIPETKDTLAARHVLSELINSMFDIDKMLYFVAPEWWKPRVKRAQQTFGVVTLTSDPDTGITKETESTVGQISVANEVGWERVDDEGREHYFITDDSDPAKLGSSLGWLLQLDGDDLRNAFLNAPWVKAVVPIRPGKERAAIEWLAHVEGMNGIGPSDIYMGDGTDENGQPLKGKPVLTVLNLLANAVAKKHAESLVPKQFDLTDPELPHDPESTVTATPVDRVWEHGFNPLQGGFQARPLAADQPGSGGSVNFQIFDQWVEILPTDQVVPVAVEYDAKTGRLK